MTQLTDRQKSILAMHFDSRWGAPYWIDLLRRRGFTGFADFISMQDLWRLGPMDHRAMRERPMQDFIPRSLLHDNAGMANWIRSETGGATGAPSQTVFTQEEFESSYVTPFIQAARHVEFPRGGTWLYIGPSGPHIISRAARALARSMGALEPYSVDFDPRWHRRLAEGTMARQSYLHHIVEQAMRHIEREQTHVLFATPAVLDALISRMTTLQRLRIRGVHYGGMRLDSMRYREYREIHFPNAVHLAGYGNSLFGCCLEDVNTAANDALRYLLPKASFHYQTVDDDLLLSSDDPPVEVPAGETGRVIAHRFSETHLILNHIERDQAGRIADDHDRTIGLIDPCVYAPLEHSIAGGLY